MLIAKELKEDFEEFKKLTPSSIALAILLVYLITYLLLQVL